MYFCGPCHDEYVDNGGRVEIKDCGGKNCPLQVKHPPANSDFSKSYFPLGCGLCRSEKLEARKETFNIGEVLTEEAF